MLELKDGFQNPIMIPASRNQQLEFNGPKTSYIVSRPKRLENDYDIANYTSYTLVKDLQESRFTTVEKVDGNSIHQNNLEALDSFHKSVKGRVKLLSRQKQQLVDTLFVKEKNVKCCLHSEPILNRSLSELDLEVFPHERTYLVHPNEKYSSTFPIITRHSCDQVEPVNELEKYFKKGWIERERKLCDAKDHLNTVKRFAMMERQIVQERIKRLEKWGKGIAPKEQPKVERYNGSDHQPSIFGSETYVVGKIKFD